MAGETPDPWQKRALTTCFPVDRMLLNVARGGGKTAITAILSLLHAWFLPGKVLIFATKLAQAQELLREIKRYNASAGTPMPVVAETTQSLEFINGSRILSLCSREEGILGHHKLTLLAIDEAARVDDAIWAATFPMTATTMTKAGVILLSTPNTQEGFYFREWTQGENWTRFLVTHDQCPRLNPERVKEYERTSPRKYRSEYCGEFLSCEEYCVFRSEDLEWMGRGTAPALFED